MIKTKTFQRNFLDKTLSYCFLAISDKENRNFGSNKNFLYLQKMPKKDVRITIWLIIAASSNLALEKDLTSITPTKRKDSFYDPY